MGLFTFAVGVMVGGGAGVYVMQNYNVPNVKKLTDNVMVKVDNIEKRYRKPKLPTGTQGATGGGAAAGEE